MKKNLKLLISIVGVAISVFLIWNLVNNYNFSQLLLSLKNVSLVALIIPTLFYLCSFIIRTFRWRLMIPELESVRFYTILESIVLGFAANNVLPMRLGEVVRASRISKETGISMETSLSSVIIEKVLDGVVIVTFLVISIYILSLTYPNLTYLVLIARMGVILFACLVLGIILTLTFKPQLQKTSYPFIAKILNSLTFFQSKNFIKIVIYSFIIWVLESLVFVFLLSYLGFENYNVIGFLLMGVVNLSILIPSSPGYLGVFETSIITALKTLGVQGDIVLTYAVLVHGIQYLPITLIAASMIIYKSVRNLTTK